MASVLYPEDLPPPSRNAFSARLGVSPRYLQMDDGGRRPIPRWVRQPLEYTVSFQFSWEQFAKFEAWWAYDLAMGTLPARLEVFPGVSEEVQFLEDYIATWSTCWNVSLRVQSRMAAPVIPPKEGMPEWPVVLPALEANGYQYKQFGGTRTNVLEGQPTARQRFATNHADVTANVLVDGLQLTAFLNFMLNDLCGSLGWFLLPVAAGAGVRKARTSLLDFQVTPQGAAYHIALNLTTFQMPRLSKFEYLYPDGLRFNEEIQFQEAFGYKIATYIVISEFLQFAERMARKLQFAEELQFSESVVKKITLAAMQEVIQFTETMGLSGEYSSLQEGTTFVETFNWLLLRRLAENVVYAENFSIRGNYSRQAYDILNMAEQYAMTLNANSTLHESTSVSESGKIRLDNYAANYFAEDYTGVVYTF